jgi:hypothetical protein
MKKLLITSFSLFLLLGLSSISAAQNTTTKKTDWNTTGRSFVDKNNDGLCDNYAAGRKGSNGRNFIDKNKDGICDNVGYRGKNVKGRNFVDKNNDGICDSHGNGNRGNGNCFRNWNGKGCGYGNQFRRRNGNR